MISSNVGINNKLASKLFREWTSIFPERFFVILVAYADESYTREKDGQFKHITFAGYIAPKIYWSRFCVEWSAALKRYFGHNKGYFHFREFANKKLRSDPKSLYFGWSEQKRDDFLYEMAGLAGSVAVPFGGTVPAQEHVKGKLSGTPIEASMYACFRDLRNSISSHWPSLDGQDAKSRVHVVFDNTESDDWLIPLNTVFEEYKIEEPVFGHITLGDDKADLPLQAADLFAYAGRQQGENNATQPRVLDLILNKNLFPAGSPKHFPTALSRLMPFSWDETIKKFREHQKDYMLQHPEIKRYLPLDHYPFAKHK